jgi:hypothetical protein
MACRGNNAPWTCRGVATAVDQSWLQLWRLPVAPALWCQPQRWRVSHHQSDPAAPASPSVSQPPFSYATSDILSWTACLVQCTDSKAVRMCGLCHPKSRVHPFGLELRAQFLQYILYGQHSRTISTPGVNPSECSHPINSTPRPRNTGSHLIPAVARYLQRRAHKTTDPDAR